MALTCAAAGPVQQPQPSWTAFGNTGVRARLRGISAVSSRVVWASGAGGTIIRTGNGGESWQRCTVPDAATLDFRDVDATDERTAHVLSIGPGEASRIYRTTDAGATWTLQFQNTDPKAFYDAMAFRDARTGYAFSDSVEGALVILKTADSGSRWSRVTGDMPAALPGEGAYAASGTNIAITGRSIWIGTSASRVLRSVDDGRTWDAWITPLRSSASAGIFSIAFRDQRHGLIVGGDYKAERDAADTAAITSDGGMTWTAVKGLGGFRSAVAYVPSLRDSIVTVGPSGADYSVDGGRTWRAIEGPGFHTLSVVPRSRSAWAAGEHGAVARLDF
jgi:photosystem II stability/assembly factor-like uncharacterized protein